MRAFAESSDDTEIADVAATLAARLHAQAQFAETAEHTLGVAIAAEAILEAFHDLRREQAKSVEDGDRGRAEKCNPTAGY